MKAFVKEPFKDGKKLSDKDLLDKLRKQSLNLYLKGEEEVITTGDNIKKPLEIGGRKFKKGGLVAIYEDRKIEAEVSIQEHELNVIKNGSAINRILPSFGRLSIFEIMNRSIGSITDDFKKLNIDSSTSSNNNETNTNLVKSQSKSIKPQSSLRNEVKIDENDFSSPKPDNDRDMNKNVFTKDDNNESNKKRRIK